MPLISQYNGDVRNITKQVLKKQNDFINDLRKLLNQQTDEAILFSDEAGIQLGPTIAAQWAPRGH
jgi:hypothetical protein